MAEHIVNWEHMFGDRDLVAHARRSRGNGPNGRVLPVGDPEGKPIAARVCHGRWIADCPWCRGAEIVDFSTLAFFCCSCRNAANAHRPVPVAVPSKRKRLRVEALLLARPNKYNRNWRAGETVAELEAENLMHGVMA